MVWRGIIKESKSFMVYDSLSLFGKLKFWLRFPRAYYRYFKLMYLDRRVRQMLAWRKGAEELDS